MEGGGYGYPPDCSSYEATIMTAVAVIITNIMEAMLMAMQWEEEEAEQCLLEAELASQMEHIWDTKTQGVAEGSCRIAERPCSFGTQGK